MPEQQITLASLKEGDVIRNDGQWLCVTQVTHTGSRVCVWGRYEVGGRGSFAAPADSPVTKRTEQ